MKERETEEKVGIYALLFYSQARFPSSSENMRVKINKPLFYNEAPSLKQQRYGWRERYGWRN
jgi:hypothetical protein